MRRCAFGTGALAAGAVQLDLAGCSARSGEPRAPAASCASICKHLQTKSVDSSQGGCGSCWAVTSAVVLTAHAEISGRPRSFAAQAFAAAAAAFAKLCACGFRGCSGRAFLAPWPLAGACGLCPESEALRWKGRLYRGHSRTGDELCTSAAHRNLLLATVSFCGIFSRPCTWAFAKRAKCLTKPKAASAGCRACNLRVPSRCLHARSRKFCSTAWCGIAACSYGSEQSIKDSRSLQPGHGSHGTDFSNMRSTGRFVACLCLQDSGHEALDVKDQYRAQVEEDLGALAYLHEPLGCQWRRCVCNCWDMRLRANTMQLQTGLVSLVHVWLPYASVSEAYGPAGPARAPRRGGLRRACLRPAGMGEAATQPPGAQLHALFPNPHSSSPPCPSVVALGQEPLLRALYERGPVGVSVAATNWQPVSLLALTTEGSSDWGAEAQDSSRGISMLLEFLIIARRTDRLRALKATVPVLSWRTQSLIMP